MKNKIILGVLLSLLVFSGVIIALFYNNKTKNDNREPLAKPTQEPTGCLDVVNEDQSAPDNNDNQDSNAIDQEKQSMGDGSEKNAPENTSKSETTRDENYAKYYDGKYITDPMTEITDISYYSYDQLLFNIRISTFHLGMDSSVYEYQNAGDSSIASLIRQCPTEAMRERPDGSRYLVYQTDDDARLYLFLSPDSSRPYAVGYPIIYKNSLKKADFDDIKAGDTITKVSEIDDICNLYTQTWFDFMDVNKLGFENRGKKLHYYSTIHYLSDGLLQIEYAELNDNGEPVVKDIKYYPDYIMETFTGKKLDMQINPLDLPR